MERFYGAQPGEDPDKTHCIVLAPTGMVSYHVNIDLKNSKAYTSRK